MPRRRKSKPSIESLIIPVGVIGFLWFEASGATLGSVISFFIWTVLIIVFLGVCIWFVKGLIKSSYPKENKFQELERQSESLLKNRSTGATKFGGAEVEEELEWSEALIDKVEWRVFEKLCMCLWTAKGFDVEETGSGADGGVDFYLRARKTKKRIGAVQCKSWNSKQIDVKTVRELQGVIASENLQLGLLMYSGVLSKPARDFINKSTVTVKEQGVYEIYRQVCLLPEHKQSELLTEITTGDYLTPSCPNCDVKMIERRVNKTGDKFLGCPNFPRCKYTINGNNKRKTGGRSRFSRK